MGLAERADVIVDFRGLLNGTRIRMINTGPDEPFGGFPTSPADPGTTGQVMEFVVDTTITGSPTDPGGATEATDPWKLVLNAEPAIGNAVGSRNVSLNEEISTRVCVNENFTYISPPLPTGLTEAQAIALCSLLYPGSEPAGPKAAKLGTVDSSNPNAPMGMPLMWTDPMGVTKQVTLQSGAKLNVNVTENPTVGDIEDWHIYNFTMDAHPMHLHLVRFQVIDRKPIPGMVDYPNVEAVQPWEKGYKDSVIAYPGHDHHRPSPFRHHRPVRLALPHRGA